MKYRLKPKINFNNHNHRILNDIEAIKIIQDVKSNIILVETYPGVDLDILKKNLIDKLNPSKIIWSEDYLINQENFDRKLREQITNDRIFAKMTNKEYKQFFDFKKINNEKQNWNKKELIIVFGIGATYFDDDAPVIHVDISRWEAQLRYRQKRKSFIGNSLEDENISNFKRGYFLEWRWADKIKKDNFYRTILFVDSIKDSFKYLTKKSFEFYIKEVSKRPFRLVPYFDAGVWGGKWMEEKLHLGNNEHNRWAWGFDGVPEENSIIIENQNEHYEMPAINLCFWEPELLMGKRVSKMFNNDFPIRFDFLDTIKGGNLSLQVHPTNKYIKEQFGMPYTQEESYYILDVNSRENPSCYLGLKTGVDKEEMFRELEESKVTNKFDVEKFVNRIPVKKHDHLLHPAGVIHSSASGCMVLEISSTPYIFTFKLWDWARLGLNGKPRPINIKHGKNVINMNFNTKRTLKELVSPTTNLSSPDGIKIEKTGLHKLQFIDTIRYTIDPNKEVILGVNDSVNMLNLVEGDSAIVESIDGSFEPLNISFAETFIVPSSCKQYKIKSLTNKKIKILQAFVR